MSKRLLVNILGLDCAEREVRDEDAEKVFGARGKETGRFPRLSEEDVELEGISANSHLT